MWQELGIAPSRDTRAIKLAYAARLKQVNPEDDPEGFKRLRAAYEWALRQAQLQPRAAARPPKPPVAAPPAPEQIQAPPPAKTILAAPLMEPPKPVPAATSPPPPPPPPHPLPAPSPPPSPPVARPQPRTPPIQSAPAVTATLSPPVILTTPSPQQAAAALFDLLLKMPQKDRPAALASALRQRGWEGLDFQAAVQKAVVVALARNFDALFPLIEVFSRHYGWQNHHRQVQFDDPAVVMLWARHAARRRRYDMEAPKPHASQSEQQALHLLLQPVDETAFRRFARRNRNLEAMRTLWAQLHSKDQEVLRHEINAAAMAWWTAYLQSHPTTWDRRASLAFGGLICGPIVVLVLNGILAGVGGFDLSQHRALSTALLTLSTLIPLGVDLTLRHWRRRGLTPRLKALRERWRHEAKQRRVAIGVTVAAVLLSAGAWNVPGFWIFAALSVLLLWFWTSLRQMLASSVMLAWPLQSPLSVLIGLAFVHWPALERHVDANPLIFWFPHWAAMFLVLPFSRLCNACFNRLFGRTPKQPGQLLLYMLLAVFAASMVLLGLLTPHQTMPSPTAPTPIHRRLAPAPAVPGGPASPSNYVEKRPDPPGQ